MKRLVLLGASGSIGQQVIEVINKYNDQFTLVGASVGERTGVLKDLVAEFDSLEFIVSKEYEVELDNLEIRYEYGSEALNNLASYNCDIVVNALVGFAGFLPSLYAIRANNDLALANKETLVAGGDVIKRELEHSSSQIYPIDSEHSAIWQCLNAQNYPDINKLWITASGGSFRDLKRSQLKNVTKAQALKHPNWSMGAKITIDSATMMNKAFEVMEAYYLFDIPYERIEILMHPESIVHSLVEFKDGAFLAQLGLADMRVPIQYALMQPRHLEGLEPKHLDLREIAQLNFSAFDGKRYILPAVVKKFAHLGGNFGAVLNGANDRAVALFLEEKISFLDIENVIIDCLRNFDYQEEVDVDAIIEADQFGRDYVDKWVKGDRHVA